MHQFFVSGGQSIGVSPSTSVLSMNIQTGWISLQSRDSQESSQHHSSKASILQCSAFVIVQLSHPYMTTGKTIALTRRNFVGKVMSLLFNMLSRLVIAFLPRSKHLLFIYLFIFNLLAFIQLFYFIFFKFYFVLMHGCSHHLQ